MEVNAPDGESGSISGDSEPVTTLACSEHMETLFTSLQDFYRNRVLTDIVLVADEVEFEAHMAVLAAYSPSFMDMAHGGIALQNCKVVVNNTSSACLELLLDFLYSGSLKLTPSNALSLYATAQQLKIESAVTLCYRYLADFVPDNPVTQGKEQAESSQDNTCSIQVKEEIDSAGDGTCVLGAQACESSAPRDLEKSGQKSGSGTTSNTVRSARTKDTAMASSTATEPQRDTSAVKAVAKVEARSPAETEAAGEGRESKEDHYKFQAHNIEGSALQTFSSTEKYQSHSQYELNRHMVTHRKHSHTDKSVGEKPDLEVGSASEEDANTFLEGTTKCEVVEKEVAGEASVMEVNNECPPGCESEPSSDGEGSLEERSKVKKVTKSRSIPTPSRMRTRSSVKKEPLEPDAALDEPCPKNEETEQAHITEDEIESSCYCKLCQKGFSKPYLLLRHEHQVHGMEHGSCSAAKQTPRTRKVKRDASKGDGIREDRYCKLCAKEFSKPYMLMRHDYQVHGIKHASFTPSKHTPQAQKFYKTTPSNDGIQEDRYCKLCNKHFSKPFILARHKVVVHGQENSSVKTSKRRSQQVRAGAKPKKEETTSDGIRMDRYCKQCEKEFSKPYMLMRHDYTVHGIKHPSYKPYQYTPRPYRRATAEMRPDRFCTICRKGFVKPYELMRHNFSVHKIIGRSMKPHPCSHPGCGYVTYNQSQLKVHQTKHVEPKVECSICHMMLKTKSSLQYHMTNVHDKLKLGAQGCYICEVCGAVFGSQKLVNQHHRRQHTDSLKPLYCEHCTYSTKSRASLCSHLYNKHGILMNSKTQEFLCEYCTYRTISKRLLIRHRFHVHSVKDEKHEVLQCPHCPYQSLDKCILDKHMQKHLIGRNFPCRYCGKYFQTADVRHSHETVVHKPKKHSCQYCSFCTAKPYQLKMHVQSMHTHPDYKPFKCLYCSTCTATSQKMWKHITRSHEGMEISYVRLGPTVAPAEHGQGTVPVAGSVAAGSELQGKDGGGTGSSQVA